MSKSPSTSLPEQVLAGEEMLITQYGKSAARLMSETTAQKQQLDEAITSLKSLRRGVRLDGLSWQELRDEGR